MSFNCTKRATAKTRNLRIAPKAKTRVNANYRIRCFSSIVKPKIPTEPCILMEHMKKRFLMHLNLDNALSRVGLKIKSQNSAFSYFFGLKKIDIQSLYEYIQQGCNSTTITVSTFSSCSVAEWSKAMVKSLTLTVS